MALKCGIIVALRKLKNFKEITLFQLLLCRLYSVCYIDGTNSPARPILCHHGFFDQGISPGVVRADQMSGLQGFKEDPMTTLRSGTCILATSLIMLMKPLHDAGNRDFLSKSVKSICF
ncbi:hypothetical protein IEQ34_009845 [Dendrobium chrysotoxum]|uniref:Uncharacterized protein n=1 Tax=Dendrobium chrysotoxum TaxID=161865 RepID=A0AAV7GK93_DENCH|nr:hypothetical protein IEQ34_009845 [Dendrobium chrysotoxum]